MATNCCCWHASRRRRVKPSIRPADTLAARRRWLSPAAMALPGGRGRASATYLTARTLRTRAGAGQMAACVRGHITANQNQLFEPIGRGVMRGWGMWLGARSVRELSWSFSLTEGRRVRGLPFYELQELLDDVPTRLMSTFFMYLSATCTPRIPRLGPVITRGCIPCVPSCMCAASLSMINV